MKLSLRRRGRVALGVGAATTVLATAAFVHWGSGYDKQDTDRVGPEICVTNLPPEASDTIQDIERGGPYQFPHKDGTVFENRDDNPLPRKPNGYYHEFTVVTPGLDHRGARRIVTGGEISDKLEDYYTRDHYRTFNPIDYRCKP